MNPKHLTAVTVIRDIPSVKKDSLPSETPPVLQQEPVEVEKPKESPAPVSDKKFHIIAASYPQKELAEAGLLQWHKKGYTGATVFHKNDRFRISIANYSSKQEALDSIEYYKQQLNREDLWLSW